MKTDSDRLDLDALKKRINPELHFGDKQTVYFIDLRALIDEVESLRSQLDKLKKMADDPDCIGWFSADEIGEVIK